MFHLQSFWYRPNEAIDNDDGTSLSESLLVWIQSEESDADDRPGVLRKMVKNIRWLAKKLETTQVILHSFAHLGESKSDPDFADAYYGKGKALEKLGMNSEAIKYLTIARKLETF